MTTDTKTKAQIQYYNVVCKNSGKELKCLGRFKRYGNESAEYCPSCVHLAKVKK